MKAFDREALEHLAFNIRRDIVATIATNGEGHVGGALSATDIVDVLYGAIMNYDPQDPLHRDKLILSAGHKCLTLYGAMAELGVIDKAELKTYNQLGTRFPGHPDATKLPCFDFSTGSLGHGLPLGCGYAMAAKLQGDSYRTYVIMGDGEQGEGSLWEAAAFAAHKKLDNLVAILDENSLQINGRTCDVCKPTDFEGRYASFGWAVRSVDGNDVGALYDALAAVPFETGKPSLIVAKTTKSKGVSFLEDQAKYHHWNPNREDADRALAELDAVAAERGWQA